MQIDVQDGRSARRIGQLDLIRCLRLAPVEHTVCIRIDGRAAIDPNLNVWEGPQIRVYHSSTYSYGGSVGVSAGKDKDCDAGGQGSSHEWKVGGEARCTTDRDGFSAVEAATRLQASKTGR